MNKEIFIGNLTKDFELHTGEISVAKSAIALNRGKDRDGNDRGVDFVNITAFGKKAETLAKWASKGQNMIFECHLQNSNYTNKEGKTIYKDEHIIDIFEFGGSKKSSADKDDGFKPAEDDPFMNIPDNIDEELPFN